MSSVREEDPDEGGSGSVSRKCLPHSGDISEQHSGVCLDLRDSRVCLVTDKTPGVITVSYSGESPFLKVLFVCLFVLRQHVVASVNSCVVCKHTSGALWSSVLLFQTGVTPPVLPAKTQAQYWLIELKCASLSNRCSRKCNSLQSQCCCEGIYTRPKIVWKSFAAAAAE